MEFAQLPHDVYYNIGLHLTYEQLLKSCSISKPFAALCHNPLFWKLKAMYDFDIREQLYNEFNRRTVVVPDGEMLEKITYLRLAGAAKRPIPGAENYIETPYKIFNIVDNLVKYDCDMDLLYYFYNKNFLEAKFSKHAALKNCAAKYGPAAMKKFIQIAYPGESIIAKRIVLSAIGEGVCRNASIDILKQFIELVNSIFPNPSPICYEGALKTIIKNGYMDLLYYLMNNTIAKISYDELKFAISTGSIEIFKTVFSFLIQTGFSICYYMMQ